MMSSMYVSLLIPNPLAPLHSVTPPPSPVVIYSEQKWEIAAILNSKPSRPEVIYVPH
jgi:hypothetical protein